MEVKSPPQEIQGQSKGPNKTITKQLTVIREDTGLHIAARNGYLDEVMEILRSVEEDELKELLAKQNQVGETPLYSASEYGQADVVRELIKLYDPVTASIKAKNGYDALHIAAKQGHLEVLKVLIEAYPDLSMTCDASNTTVLQTAATQGHVEVVNFLLGLGTGLATIARSNGKTSLHSASRNGHVAVVNSLLQKEPGIGKRVDKKGQTALHMAVKGPNLPVVEELIKDDPSLINMTDTKGNTPLHIAARKGRHQIVVKLIAQSGTDTQVVNKAGETALDTAEKMCQQKIFETLQEHGAKSAKAIKPQAQNNNARELKQTVSDIKHEVHHQLEHTRQTRRRVQGIAKRVNKMHTEGLNNAINSTTVVASLIATIAFGAIFTIPGQFVTDPTSIPPGSSFGEAELAPNPVFLTFFVFNSLALFISLAVVVVQTSVVVIESKAKKQMMAIINKLMWLACVLITVSFLAMSYIIVGAHGRWMATAVTIIGTTIMATTLGTMCYWVIQHRMEARTRKSLRKASVQSKSTRSWSVSDSEILNAEKFKKVYAI